MLDGEETDHEPNEFLEAEKKKDPQEWAEQYMKRAEALVAAGEKARQARSVEDAYLTAAPPAPRTLVFNVRKIDNGFILVMGSEGLAGHYSVPIKEKYFPTPEELVKGAAAAVEAFVKGVPA